ncbi:hypothetical protein [Flavicella sediminum]|uniref:hypothetical protein n=1 Tax=Flavicella sediminum TaxID=2585141 RepID=UPI00111F58DB|nr:hypothetical protein [Flavicella sediminum]
MKNLTYIFLAVLISVSSLSCSSNDTDLGLGGGNSLSVKIDGTKFESLGATTSAVVTSGVLSIQGGKSNGETLRITLMNYTGKGTYKTGDHISNTNGINYITLTPIATWTSTFDIGSGTVTITKDTGSELEGTFSFVGVNGSATKNFTEGKFSIDY